MMSREKIPANKKAKSVSVVLYPDEIVYIRNYVKRLHEYRKENNKMPWQECNVMG